MTWTYQYRGLGGEGKGIELKMWEMSPSKNFIKMGADPIIFAKKGI